jgi:hypothetical protein
MARGLAMPDATISTEKPGGTCGLTPAGSGATSLKLGVDLPIGGRSRGVSRRLMPGLSCCHEPRAAIPFSNVPFLSSAAEEDALAFASTTRAAAAVLTMLCIRTLHQGWTSRGHHDHRLRAIVRAYASKNEFDNDRPRSSTQAGDLQSGVP